jgi:predicted nucleic acid-binding protein
MIVLDTNVVSEPLRPTPSERVIAWLDRQHLQTLYLSTITLAELRYGIAALPNGRRKQDLGERVENALLPLFVGRVCDFDDAASRAYPSVQVASSTRGRPLGALDALIAATCLSRGFALATRNVRHFDGCGLELINPWVVET